MAIYFDANGNLVDTEINESSNVFMEDPTENFYPPSQFPPTSYGFINAPQSYYPSNNISPTQDFYPPDLTSTKGLPTLDLKSLPANMGVANETDEEQVDYLPGQEPSGIAQLVDYLPFGEKSLAGTLLRTFLPKSDPRATNIRNFYGQNYGLTDIGQVDSGIMKGYNPVSGSDFLNKITGGLLPARSFGLADAARRRIERIANRKMAQTEASRAKIAALQKFAREDTTNRARFNNPSVYASADKKGFTDSSGGFKSAGTNENFSNKTGRGRTGY